MRDANAKQLLARVIGWQDEASVVENVFRLQLLADYKYDSYQRFGPGKRFMESLALWLKQFDTSDREGALKLVTDHLVFFSDADFSHLVEFAYPDVIVQERLRLIGEEQSIPSHAKQRLATLLSKLGNRLLLGTRNLWPGVASKHAILPP